MYIYVYIYMYIQWAAPATAAGPVGKSAREGG